MGGGGDGCSAARRSGDGGGGAVNAVNDWVPTAAFIEYYVLEEALGRDVSIRRASSTVVPKFGLKPNGPFLHKETRLLGMLYTLLVFPRERWNREDLIEIVVERALADKELSSTSRKLLNSDFLRHMRNAVSHARVDFSDDAVTFRDGKNDAALTFEASLSIPDSVNLLLVLGRAFHESAQVKDTLTNLGRAKQ
ncbi:HEPN family nuclease [Ostreiculturibacter nitratireducens]|uniref:HEPN family nuclease n=1 Tax=Ostreiculturibacter nitratireducens TaxID=3075226 RepID=UPI0031B56C41